MERRIGGSGSVIAIDSKGNFGKASNLPVMLWAQMADGLIDYHVERKAWFCP
jgi:isoaspartyl peptidase/L-asparaginase-like protein (Ntn-hydrolase superfamily)